MFAGEMNVLSVDGQAIAAIGGAGVAGLPGLLGLAGLPGVPGSLGPGMFTEGAVMVTRTGAD